MKQTTKIKLKTGRKRHFYPKKNHEQKKKRGMKVQVCPAANIKGELYTFKFLNHRKALPTSRALLPVYEKASRTEHCGSAVLFPNQNIKGASKNPNGVFRCNRNKDLRCVFVLFCFLCTSKKNRYHRKGNWRNLVLIGTRSCKCHMHLWQLCRTQEHMWAPHLLPGTHNESREEDRRTL